MNEFTSIGREVFALFYAKVTWRCHQGGKAAEQFRPLFITTTMKYFCLRTIFAWLLMTMLFPLAIHAEEGYYYIGYQDNWTPGNKTYQFTKMSDGKTWTLTMNVQSSDEFKIAPLSVESWGDWDKILGVSESSSGLSGSMSYEGANFNVTSPGMSSYTINIVPSEMTYEIEINGKGTTPENPLSVEEAIQIGNNLPKDSPSMMFYYIKGTGNSLAFFDGYFSGEGSIEGSNGSNLWVDRLYYFNYRLPLEYIFLGGSDIIVYAELTNRTNIGIRITDGCLYSINGITDTLNENDIFISRSLEGDDMLFSVLDAEKRTCQVGGKNPKNNGYIKVGNHENVTIPEYANNYKVIGIESFAFYNNKYIKDVTIPNGVTFINSNTFEGCPNLMSVKLSESLEIIGDSAFYNDIRLSSINFPINLKKIGNRAFWGCSQIAEVNLPEGNLTEIGDEAFSLCALTSIALPDGLKTVGKKAFANCKQLADVKMTNSVENIGESTFAGCENLKNITLSENLNQISDGLFAVCYSLASITIPNSVMSIGDNAFYGCIGLTSITIPNSVTSIGDNAFQGCLGLTSVTIPNSVTSIGGGAFSGCSSLISVTISNSVTSIGKMAFAECNSLEKVIVSDLTAWSGISYTYSTDNPLSLAHHLYNENGIEITDLVIPDGVETINSYAFYGGSNFTSVTIPSSLKAIKRDAFKDCNNIMKVIVPDLAAWCNIDFESSYANPLIISGYLYKDNDEEITDLIIPYGVKEIKTNTFHRGNFSSVSLPSGLKKIGSMAFYYCENIRSIVIPNGVEILEDDAFAGCSNLGTVVIPNSVTSIGGKAFVDCLSLYSVTSLINIPFNLNESVFWNYDNRYDKNIIYMAATLYVPRGRTTMYRSVKGWKNFQNIVEIDTKFNLTYMVDDAVYKNYEIQATEVVTPEPDPYKEGYEFSGWSTIPSVMPAHDVVVTGSFTPTSGINDVIVDDSAIDKIYSIDGKVLNKQQKGMNIIRMNDGHVRKIVVK